MIVFVDIHLLFPPFDAAELKKEELVGKYQELKVRFSRIRQNKSFAYILSAHFGLIFSVSEPLDYVLLASS